MLEPDMGSTIIVVVIGISLLFVGGIRLRHLLHVVGAGLGIGLVLAIVEPYRRARLFSFFDPIHHMADDGYQVVQSWVALGSGGWTGVGLGAGRAKWAFLPNAHTDFILAIVGEELGLIGCVAIIGLFVAFGIVGARIALQAPDRFGMLVAAGVTVWVCLQAFINVCAVIGLLPVTGIPLPFVSFGGSSLLFTMLGTGVLANIASSRSRGRWRMTTTTGTDGHVFALITGGGTGGHVYPALALAGELVARGHSVPAVHFVGSRRGLEASAVPSAGFSIDLLDTRGIERTLSFRSVQAVFSILWAMIVAVRIVRRCQAPRGGRRWWVCFRAMLGGSPVVADPDGCP